MFSVFNFNKISSIKTDLKSLPTFDRKWKTEFFFVSRFWVGNLVKVGRDPFLPYTSEMGNLPPGGMSIFTTYFFSFLVPI